jgi:hypothetical protein
MSAAPKHRFLRNLDRADIARLIGSSEDAPSRRVM